MPKFSEFSKNNLSTCSLKLQLVFNEVIRHVDCRVLEGYRTDERQDELYSLGKTQLRGGESKHNKSPSLAVDVVPYPIDWTNVGRMLLFSGFVLGTATQMGIIIRSGSDWNMNFDPSDQDFMDYVHFELVED